jgi:hypothetical protein
VSLLAWILIAIGVVVLLAVVLAIWGGFMGPGEEE